MDLQAADDSATVIDRFIDALWLEDGLSANTLAAYRRDLQGLQAWLTPQGLGLIEVTEPTLQGYFAQIGRAHV